MELMPFRSCFSVTIH